MTPEPVVYRPRFGADIDKKLRRLIWKRGELVNLIVLILQSIDLSTIPLIEIDWGAEKIAETTVKLPASLHSKLKSIAGRRGISMNILINSAISAYTPDKNKTPLSKK